jgi:hypothetical protein
VQDLTVPTNLACTPSFTGFGDHIQFASIAITGGSFTGSATDTGVIDNSPATYTYTFNGNFHGTNTSGTERVAGQLRETITFDNGTSYSCTTGPQTWSATYAAQGTQTTSAPPAGSYTVSSLQGFTGSLYVSSDGTKVQDLTVPTNLACTPSFTGFGDHIQFASIAITGGSFTGSATATGTIDSSPATFAYTFDGNFHGTNASGAERVAGQLRETITFDNGTSYSCTTGPQTWSGLGP